MTESSTQPEEIKPSALGKLWRRTERYRIIFLFALIALAILMTPLQHSITLSRYQHWGMSILCLGCGYMSQVIWSWKNFTGWARASYLSTACYFVFVGITFYANPWLDARMSVQTEDQVQQRFLMLICYLCMSIILSAIWLAWIGNEAKNQGKQGNPESGSLEKERVS